QTDTAQSAATTSASSQSLNDSCSFSIVVRTSTSDVLPARANLFIQMTDAAGRQNDKIRLKCSVTHRKKFQPGHCDLFVLADQTLLEDIKSIEVFHQKREAGPPLPLHSITVMEHNTHTAYHFACDGYKMGGAEPEDRTMKSFKFACTGNAPVFTK
ncbi:hypothetical protein PFISCL1PPCAC_4595, partial [Pristionchus fissidentatus]